MIKNLKILCEQLSINNNPDYILIAESIKTMIVLVVTSSFHDIRHLLGSVIFNTTGDIKVVSYLLGHSNISTASDIYVKTNVEHKKEVLNNLENVKK